MKIKSPERNYSRTEKHSIRWRRSFGWTCLKFHVIVGKSEEHGGIRNRQARCQPRNALRDKSSREVEHLCSICIDLRTEVFKRNCNFQFRARGNSRTIRNDGNAIVTSEEFASRIHKISPRSHSQPLTNRRADSTFRFDPVHLEKVCGRLNISTSMPGKKGGAAEKVEVTTGPRWPRPKEKQMEKVSTSVWLTGNMSRSKLVAKGKENQSTAVSGVCVWFISGLRLSENTWDNTDCFDLEWFTRAHAGYWHCFIDRMDILMIN